MNGRLLRQALSVVINRGLMNLCNVVTFILLARLLTSTEFGIYGVFTSGLFLVETAGNIGLRQANAHQVGQGLMTDAEAFGASLMLWPVSATVSGLLVWWVIAGSVPSGDWWQWLGPCMVGAFSVVLAALSQGIFLGRGQISFYSLVEVLPRVLLLGGVVVMMLLGLVSVEEQSWLFSLSFGCAAVIGLVLARPAGGGRWVWNWPSLKRLLRIGWPFALTVFLSMLNTRVSVFILSHQFDPASAGQYFAALRLNDLLLQAAASVGLVLFSHGARAPDPQQAIGQAAQATRLLIWATVIVTAAGLALAPVLVPLLLGAEYSNSIVALQCLLLALPFATLSKVLSPILSGLGRPLLGALVLAPAIGLNAGLSFWLSVPLGVTGAAVALAVTQVFIAAGLVLLMWKVFGRRPGEFVLPRRSDIQHIAAGMRRRLARRTEPKNVDQ